jgi:hypothetical protein
MPRIPSGSDLGAVVGFGFILVLVVPVRGLGQPPELARELGPARFRPLDLQPWANQPRKDDFHQTNLPGNNLEALTGGEQKLIGIPFRVGDGVLQLGSSLLPGKPNIISGIRVGKTIAGLHIVHATAYSVDEEDIAIGSYTVRYADGTTALIPIVNGRDVRGWWKRPGAPEPSHGKVAWEGTNACVAGMGASIRLYMSTWRNLRPQTAVVSIDYASAMTKSAPFCVAITAAERLTARVASGPVTTGDLDRLWTQLAGDGNQANDAVEILAGVPKQAIPFLSTRLRAVQPAAAEERVGTLITQLDEESFAARERATRELEHLGSEALHQLRRTLDRPTSPESRHRVERLVDKIKGGEMTADQSRLYGAVLVLEVIGTAEARNVLDEVCQGRAGAWLAPAARAALRRLEK